MELDIAWTCDDTVGVCGHSFLERRFVDGRNQLAGLGRKDFSDVAKLRELSVSITTLNDSVYRSSGSTKCHPNHIVIDVLAQLTCSW
eukprot:COSAG02_NODE_5242_length_4511_cov_8.198549_3_plen_87_part_00